GTNTDISERMEMERALREADQRKDEFLATLAHELRNPLAPIASGVELLRLRPNDPDVAMNVQRTLARQTANLVRLVDDLLDVSRITRGTVELRRSEIELTTVVTSALEASRPLIDRADHQLTVDLPAEPILLDADPVRLGQVFSNLLNNAAKYTPRGGRISIEAGRGGGEAVVTVSDTGLGFEPEAAGRLFDLFAQDERGGRERSGLGIGLTLARALVELHGGTLTAASEGPGHGSRFTVRLPLAASGQAAPPPATARRDPERSPRSGLRVLIADDNRDAADGLRELLEVFGHDARAVYSGEAALTSVTEAPPQVVLLDLGMPGLDGYETAHRLRDLPEGRSLVLIALTGWGQEEDRRRTRDAGFDHHLVKPADLDTLRRLLEEIGERLDAEG
ncbi:MAG TPA: ATP-binding protein, partial [Thermoanaerobaculia bacterium]|nr:ATP-binding protein [Thermoanaerobaculia bacterium]